MTPKTHGSATIALGCMNFGKRTPKAEALRIVGRAFDEGVTLFDTANMYERGSSERILGEALRGRREGVWISTKVGADRVAGEPEGLSHARVLAACDESRARLDTDVIDLYSLHVPDPSTPIEATLDAIATLLAAGRIRHWGVSNHASWQILELRHLAVARGLPPPLAAQQLYNPLVRQLDLEYFRFAKAYGVVTTVFNPLAGGLLTARRFELGAPPREGRFGSAFYRRRYWRPAMLQAVEGLRTIADGAGVSLAALAYAFVLGHPGVDAVIVGPATVAHLDEALAARATALPDATRAAVEAVYTELVGTDTSYAR